MTIKRIVLCNIPSSICNLRCRYCYLAQRDDSFQGKPAGFLYSPEYVGNAFSIERMGGPCYFNLCAEGETLLAKGIEDYIYHIVKQGHYVEVVTNLTVTSVLDKILAFDGELLERITFKCSFHYLQLKERNLLELFSENVNKIWNHHCSASIEITPDDELISYIDEVKEFSYKYFGALPHLTIARDDNNNKGYLTELSLEEYNSIWEQFNSPFWEFKRSIFNVYREEYCYAGAWSLYVNLANGDTTQCYCSRYTQNIFDDISRPIDFLPIGKCLQPHCYNGHALLTLGCIPGFTSIRYGDIRDRVCSDGRHWIQPAMLEFLNSKLEDNNDIASTFEKFLLSQSINIKKTQRIPKRLFEKIFYKN